MATASIAPPVLVSEGTVGTTNSAEHTVTPVNVSVLY